MTLTTATRRTLLGAGAAGIALGPLLVGPEAFAALSTRRGLYTRGRFAALKRRSFRLQSPEGSWKVRLTRVANLPHGLARDEHAFRLTFRAARTGPPQGSYLLSRPGFRPTTLFVVPDEQRRSYEAVVFRRP